MSKKIQKKPIAEQQQVVEQLERVIEIFEGSQGEIRPHFILTGPSGSGKSHIIKALATRAKMNFMEINAAQLTKEGTSGNSLSKALSGLINNNGRLTICFVDEFDKLFISGNSNSQLAHETTNGVQNEFLKVLESESTEVYGDFGKYISVSVDNVLFVFAGAFNGETDVTIDKLRNYGIKTEFLGRVGLVYNLEKLSIDSMEIALEHSELLANYLVLFPDVNRQLVIDRVMAVVRDVYEKNTLGIRLLNTLLHRYFINDGKLVDEEVKASTFQTSLRFKNKQASE